MKNYIGIDLGTTNSAICSYDGSEIRVWKSPEQNDVTPSAIYIDRRGNKYVGKRAYDMAPNSPDNSAVLFKRLMGTSTPIKFAGAKQEWTPEQCSAEVLKVLFGYLPEEIRNDTNSGVVITVPAAFNQMQKEATMQAANLAGLGNVALMQEPVAAVMSVIRARNLDGMFLIYDLGGGTLDIAIAESIGGRVSLLAHGGIAMCGGRDFDRAIVDNIVRPWLEQNFSLPENYPINKTYKSMMRLASWASEKAKIELSAKETSVISLSESEIRTLDLDGNEIYLDILLTRGDFNKLIEDRVNESIEATRATLSKAGLSPEDLSKIVFIGGPTNYKPLRDKVVFELGIPGSMDVNPMTAVAEGASLFAESIDWSSHSRSRKSSRGQLKSSENIPITFNYISRTPDSRTKIAVHYKESNKNYEFQVDSLDTGWTSGRIALKRGVVIEISLSILGDNTFKVTVFDENGRPINLNNNKITITRTAATIDGIPASYSIGIEVLEKLGGRPILDYLVRSGDMLPKKGKKVFKAAETLKAGEEKSLNLKLWEGDIEDPITDNRPIGVLKISGNDFYEGIIPAGADLECEYEILDSGNILLEVSVPCIGGTFKSGKNFYSREEGQIDFSNAGQIVFDEGKEISDRLEEMSETVDCDDLDLAKAKLEAALNFDKEHAETETTQEAMEKLYEVKKLLAKIRKKHQKEIRELELNKSIELFNSVQEFATEEELNIHTKLVNAARQALSRDQKDFSNYLDEIRGQAFRIYWKQDEFVIGMFNSMKNEPHKFQNKSLFFSLINQGVNAINNRDITSLRQITFELLSNRIKEGSDSQFFDLANIVRG